ncbi:TPA: tail assembly protein [Proteus mirabilis]|nr:tail assembly protein [Proteus mirabilis]
MTATVSATTLRKNVAQLIRGDEEKGNTYFSNLDNAVAQGMPVPIAYGEIMCGSRVISQSVEIMDDSDGENIDAGKHGG